MNNGQKTLSFYSVNASNNAWIEINASASTSKDTKSRYIFGAVGSHKGISENLLVGGILEFDHLSSTKAGSGIEGTGWLVGPYFVAKHPIQPFYAEGRLLYGQSNNTVSPFGTYRDEFKTERMLAQLELSGEFKEEHVTWRPLLDLSYTRDKQLSYTDSLGNFIPKQGIALAQVTFGLDFETQIPVENGKLELTGGISGIWADFAATGNATGVIAAQEGGRGRLDLGLNYEFENNKNLMVSTFYDGIGKDDYEAYGINLSFELEF